jgi:hypothetical protein
MRVMRALMMTNRGKYIMSQDQVTFQGITFNRVTDQLYRWENKYFTKLWFVKKPNEYQVLNKVTNQVQTFIIYNHIIFNWR